MKRTITRQRSSRSAARPPASAAPSETRFRDVPMFIPPCVSPARQTRAVLWTKPCRASCPRGRSSPPRRTVIRPMATRSAFPPDWCRKSTTTDTQPREWNSAQSSAQLRPPTSCVSGRFLETSLFCSAAEQEGMAAAARPDLPSPTTFLHWKTAAQKCRRVTLRKSGNFRDCSATAKHPA